MSINASAEGETYTKMTASQLRSLIGDTIPFNYTLNGVEYSGNFVYSATRDFSQYTSVMGYNVSDNPVFGTNKLSNYEGVYYYWVSDFSSATSLYDVDIKLNMNFSGGARGGFMAGGLGSATPSNMTTDLNSTSNGGNFIGGVGISSIITGNTQADLSLSEYYGVVAMNQNPSPGDTLRPLYYNGTNLSINHIYYNRIRTSNMNAINRQVLQLWVIAPYKYGNLSVSTTDTTTTTTGTTSPSSDINVTVNVDNTETNSILSDIWDSITGLVSGIAHLFIPDDDYIENWLEDMGDVISDAFTDKVNLDVLKDLLIDIGTYGNTSSIQFPAITIGESTIPARAVQLKPSGFDTLFNFAETAINLVCTIWVFNMVLLRIKAVFVGEQVVEVEGDVE